MPSRAELELRAGAVNVDPDNYPNDSKFEQAVIYAEKAVEDTNEATQVEPSDQAKSGVSGGANV